MDADFFSQGPDDNNRVPGDLIVKVTQDLDRRVTESIPSGPLRTLDLAGPTRFGVTTVDRALRQLKVASVVRVHAPMPSVGVNEAAAAAAADLGATYRLRFDPAVGVDDAVQALQGVNGVVEASPNYYRWALLTPNDPMFGVQWWLPKVNAPSAWDRTRGDPSVVVAVIDTGVDLDHPDLQANLVAGQDLVDLTGVTPPPGTRFEGDFTGRDATPDDEVGHGTHVAGIIAALTDNGTGVAGMAGNCAIMPVKVLARVVRIADGRVSGSGTAVDIAAGIRWAVDHGARILNLSLGGYTDTFVERDAIAYAVAQGAVVCAAMGNDNTTQPSFPAGYPGVVAVGATTSSDTRASFSNTGPHIDVSAPGVGIRSTDWDNTYSDKSGTSMATPVVAGTAALIRSCNPGLTAAEIAQILRDTARPLRDNPADPVPNDQYGSGLVDAQAALNRACPTIPPPCPPPCLPCRPPCPPPCRPPCPPCRPPCPPCPPPCLPPPCPPPPCLPPPCLPPPCPPPPCQPPCPPCQPCVPPCPPCVIGPAGSAAPQTPSPGDSTGAGYGTDPGLWSYPSAGYGYGSDPGQWGSGGYPGTGYGYGYGTGSNPEVPGG